MMPVITPRIFERLLAAFQACIKEVSNSANIDSLKAVFLLARVLSEGYHDELILNGISHVLMRKLDLLRNTIVQKEQSEVRDFLRDILQDLGYTVQLGHSKVLSPLDVDKFSQSFNNQWSTSLALDFGNPDAINISDLIINLQYVFESAADFAPEVDPKSPKMPILQEHLEILKGEFATAFRNRNLSPALRALFERYGYEVKDAAEDTISVNHLRESMSVPFVGLSSEALVEYLTACQKAFTTAEYSYYGKFGAVCNSSGTGKTKAILELAHHGVIVVYINLRPPSSRDFPPRDSTIASLFETASVQAAYTYHYTCTAIFVALFRELYRTLKRRISDAGKPPSRSSFAQAVFKWNEEMSLNLDESNASRREFFAAVCGTYNSIRESRTENQMSLCDLLVEKYQALLKLLTPFVTSAEKPMLVIALDDYQTLTKYVGGYTPSHIVAQVIHRYSTSYDIDQSHLRVPVWVLFSSKDSKPSHFGNFPASPTPDVIHPSMRILPRGTRLFRPFTIFSWDVFARPFTEIDMRSIDSYETVISFGRPLWRSVSSIYPSAKSISAFAKSKLCPLLSELPLRSLELFNDTQALVILSQRFALELNFGNPETDAFNEDSVEHHMRYFLSILDDQFWKYKGIYASEPILSNAAAELMYCDDSTLGSLLACLGKKVKSGMIDARNVGILLNRLLLLTSRDIVTLYRIHGVDLANTSSIRDSVPFGLSVDYPERSFPHHQLVPLLDVLTMLFGPTWISDRQDIRETFGNAFVSMSHWVTMTGKVGQFDEGLSVEEWLKRLFVRGCAIQCCRKHSYTDQVIPIAFLDKDGKYEGISSCLVKNKSEEGQEHPCPIDCGLDTGKPYVVVVFNFGVSDMDVEEAIVVFDANKRTPRLAIEVQGLCARVLPVLEAYSGSLGEGLEKIRSAAQARMREKGTIQERILKSMMPDQDLEVFR